jgi:hypothetical protein
MHEAASPALTHMDLMRKRLVCSSLFPALLVGVLCMDLHSSARPTLGILSLQAQQQSGQESPATAGDQSVPEKLSLSDQVIQDLLEPLKTGLETQNAQMVLSVFDKKELSGYSDLQGQLQAFFHQYSDVRFRYQILQATADTNRGTATAEFEMDALPYEVTQVAARRSVQMRLQLKLEPKGWKVISFSPSDFFNLGFNRSDNR